MDDLTLDLRACQTVALNLPEDGRRRESVTQACADAGLNLALVEGIKASPGRTGCALSHLRALRAYAETRPLLVLEDDVRLTEDYRPEIRYPPTRTRSIWASRTSARSRSWTTPASPI